MNYPVWDVPASGLLIAAIGILHVFISHFAIGGGLFLVLTERKARREGDTALLGYVRAHSRFFAVLTLVVGAISGVGIWFTIGMIQPQATATLITTFVWLWAIEWTMFVTEIAAALIYYYGWDRLSPAAHLRVGWIYFGSAWLSLVVIGGILSFMATPGEWVTTRRVLDAFLNPTFLSTIVGRSFTAVGLAGLYALLTASRVGDRELKARVARYAGFKWVAPMTLAIPVSLAWYLAAAQAGGVPVAEILGAKGGGVGAVIRALVPPGPTGFPTAQHAAVVGIVASVVALAVTLVVAALRPKSYGRVAAWAVLGAGFVAVGSAEFVREDLRKPYVIGRYMFVNGIRLPAGVETLAARPDGRAALESDPFTIEALDRTGVLGAAPWVRVPQVAGGGAGGALDARAKGAEVFRLECMRCHTVSGYRGIQPLVRGKALAAIAGILSQLAKPVNRAGQPAAWNAADVSLVTWRGRRMPPVVGTADERHALAVYLAMLGGETAEAIGAEAATTDTGRAYFDSHCAACHGSDTAWPMAPRVRGRSADALYELLGRLPAINDAMPTFDGTDAERRALAAYVATLGTASAGKGEPR